MRTTCLVRVRYWYKPRRQLPSSISSSATPIMCDWPTKLRVANPRELHHVTINVVCFMVALVEGEVHVAAGVL